jgi:integrase/recombinase XerD
VDSPNALLTIRGSKFYKSRLVPISRHLMNVLEVYARKRPEKHPSAEAESRFFLSKRGIPIPLRTLQGTFQRLRKHAGVRRSKDARYQPRLHDLRHTFAVHRLTAWYRQGADVQRLLNYLSVYLGHAHLAGTQVYLTMTPELMDQAGKRFERYARGETSHE